MPYLETRNVPAQWLPGNTTPVGVTAADYAVREAQGEGPWNERFTEAGFSPQIALRFQWTDDLMLYGRYAEATKIGGFDTGQISIPTSLDQLAYDSEESEQIELGIKGVAFDDRLSFDADVFELEFPNLQTAAISPDPNQTSASVNAGQRVRGFEFNTLYAVTEKLRVGFSGAFMNGVMTDFKNSGCTNAEIAQAVGNPEAPCKFFNGGAQFFPTDIIDAVDAEAAYIDRTGSQAPRTPDWKFVLSVDYYTPIGGAYEFMFNAKGYVSDGYILAVESFDLVTKYNQHEDLNLIFGIRNVENDWALSLFARNLLEARPSYNAEYDAIPDGLEAVHLSPSSFTSYGIKLEYFLE
jgi:iron complex outermembrane receptor protein